MKQITGCGIGSAFNDIFRMMYVHGEVVAPDVTLPDCGDVESGDCED
jgi:hypothetical protein